MTLRIPKTHIWRRFCWRRLRMAAMIVYPQGVSYYGATEHADHGTAECTACGGKHAILGGRGYVE